jgi:glycerol-3-phosphate acyltransferase PlsX
MKSVYRIPSPRVALLSVGTEDEKGNAQTKEAFSLMRESGLNFAGNMEARTALSGDVDVIVADGFAGNILLKTVEGTAKSVVTRMVKMLGKHAGGQDISFVKSAVGELFRELDFNSMGGAIILGLKKPIIKAHGSANEMTMVNTVKQAVRIAEGQAGIVK